MGILLVVPAMAVVHHGRLLGWPFLFTLPLVASVISFVLCYRDKQRARAGEWRTPESTLHLFELLGGWPGSFVAQKRFRHKTSKSSYQFTFWVIVLMYEAAAVDSLRDWTWGRSVIQFGHAMLA